MNKRFGWLRSISLLAICAVCCRSNWLKMNDLDFDPARWLFECARAAAGEFPYRDFSWQFPPVSLAIFAALFRSFGSTFLVAQIGLDVLSGVAVILFLALARALFRDTIAWALTVLFVAMGEMANTLFTLRLYTPALLTGLIGTLLMLVAAAGFLRTPQFRVREYVMLCTGSLMCLLSKPEFVLGCLAIGIALAIADRLVFRSRAKRDWAGRQLGLTVAMYVPAAAVYLWIGVKAGWQNLWQGFSGYGGAATSCPWWPTGFGFFCVLGGVGTGVLLLGSLSLFGVRPWQRHIRLLGFLAIPGLLATMFHLYLIRSNILAYGSQPLWYRIFHYVVLPDTVVFPFVCLGLVAFPAVVAWLPKQWSLGNAISPHMATLLVLFTAAVTLSARAVFGTLESARPTVAVAAEPIWLFLAVALFLPLLAPADSRAGDAPARWVTGVLIAYAVFLLFGYLSVEFRRPYPMLQTRAGGVRLGQLEPDASLYRILEQTEQPGEGFVDLPYGGGLSFAARLRSPLFTTQHTLLPIPFHYLDRDLRRIASDPPRLALVADSEHFGTAYGGHQGCSFPAITWIPGRGDAIPGYVYPIVDFLRRNYTVAGRYRGRLLLAFRGEASQETR
jgi:hypothetical protein